MPDQQPQWGGEPHLERSLTIAAWYRRERIKTIVAAMLATTIVALAVSVVIGNQLTRQAHRNAIENCEVQAAGRPSGNARALAIQQVLRIADKAFRRFPARFQQVENARINRELYRARRFIPGYPTKVNGFGGLKALIDTLPLIDCTGTIE